MLKENESSCSLNFSIVISTLILVIFLLERIIPRCVRHQFISTVMQAPSRLMCCMRLTSSITQIANCNEISGCYCWGKKFTV